MTVGGVYEYPEEVMQEAVEHRRSIARYCHGIENQLSFALNTDLLSEELKRDHPEWDTDAIAKSVSSAIRLKGPFST